MMERKEGFAYIEWEGKEYPIDVKHSERFKKVETIVGRNFKKKKETLALIGAGIRTTVGTIDYVDDDDNQHGHDVPALLYVSYKDLKDGKDEVRVIAASDDLLWFEEIGKAVVTVNPLKSNKGQWGGKREGAGRKVSSTKSVIIRLSETQHQTLKDMGGSAWLQKLIDNFEGHKMLDMTTLTEEQRQAFIEGWTAAGGYTDDLNGYISSPWCCPWYHGNTKIEVTGDDPRAWGAQWWSQCKDEIEQLLKEEREAEE
ncbi:MAG TPA: hypothetical protein IAC45_00700 [Candidatus Aphodousia faecavium]|nr:hypothetical protein [Candidatus Aphodousia faecavium]